MLRSRALGKEWISWGGLPTHSYLYGGSEIAGLASVEPQLVGGVAGVQVSKPVPVQITCWVQINIYPALTVTGQFAGESTLAVTGVVVEHTSLIDGQHIRNTVPGDITGWDDLQSTPVPAN